MQKPIILFVSLSLACLACSPVRVVSTDPIARQSLASVQTFAFAKLSQRVEVKRSNSESIKNYVKQAVIEALEDRGFQLVKEQPDLLVDLDFNVLNYQTEQRSGSRYSSRRTYYYTYRYNYGYDPTRSAIQTDANMQALFSLTLAHAQSKQYLGQGKAEAQLSRSGRKSTQRLDEAVERLISQILGS